MELDELLRDIEPDWLSHASSAIAAIIRQNPAESFYAAAFWLFYCDYRWLAPPALAVNCESAVVSLEGEQTRETRWRPSEWRWSVLDKAIDEMKPRYLELSAKLAGATPAVWEQAVDANYAMLDRVCAAIMRRATSSTAEFSGLKVRSDFIVYVEDDELTRAPALVRDAFR